jgi:hypothetical protein
MLCDVPGASHHARGRPFSSILLLLAPDPKMVLETLKGLAFFEMVDDASVEIVRAA